MDFEARPEQPLPLPFSYWDLRQAARSGFTLEARRFYWPHAISFAPKATVVELQDIPAAAQRMYDRVSVLSGGTEEGFEDVRLSWNDESGMVQQVMRAVTSHFPVGEPWLLEPLVKHVARVLDNTAVCFYFFCSYMEKSYWYSIPNLSAYRYKMNTFRQLAKRCMKRTYAILLDIGALEERHLNSIFVDMMWELLPEQYFYQVLDMYFIEGYKVLYRFGLALIKVHKAKIKRGEFSNGEEFWAALKRGAKDESFDFDPIFKLAFDQRRNNLFKISIVPGRSRLQDFEESTRATMTQEELTAPLQIHMPSSLDSIESNTLFSTAALNRRELLHHNSNIMDEQMAKRLHSFLLPAAQMEGFELKFSTAYDGWNLQTLYSKTQHLSPCILLVNIVEDVSATIGMYLSCSLSPPSPSVRGDGMCFCFRLDGEATACCNRWVGQTHYSVRALQATQFQFAVCSNDFMAFGGSSQYGTNALRLSADLLTCEAGESDTFCNASLVPESRSNGVGLKVGGVEVFCGKLSHSRVTT